MFVVVTYDVPADRTEVFRKLLVRYLTHEQKSVFAGDLRETSWRKLKAEISTKALPNDRILVFRSANRHNISATSLSKSAGNGALVEKPILHHDVGTLIL